MMRFTTLLCLAGLSISLGGCAARTIEERLLDPRHMQAASIATETVAEGITGFREGRGIDAICVGDWQPNPQQDAFQRAIARRLTGRAPIVVDARDCERSGDGVWRVKESEEPALLLEAAEVEWETNQVGNTNIAVFLDDLIRFDYDIQVVSRGGLWTVNRIFCNPRGNRGHCVPIDRRVARD